ncbi:MAG: hypothetical protein GXY50_01700 [Syntrophomonadaceae bacterium]|nr:hypothetical protein [Syntrophomonadaceae bacterium]
MKVMDELGKYLFRFFIFALVALVLVQGLMTDENFRFYLSLGERLEGKKIDQPVAADFPDGSEKGVLAEISSPESFELVLRDYSSLDKAKVLINGRVMGSMLAGRIKLYVTAGDVIEVDTQAYPYPVSIEVVNAGESLSFPQEGMIFTSEEAVLLLGKIEVE